ncbi:MAG: hypothetical protein Fur006_60360 [Coleofasciculaceae cyanobacterium]
MAIWVGVFLNNIDGKSVRELEVEADNEEEAIIQLDLYDYDKTWQNYLFVKIYKKRRSLVELLMACTKKPNKSISRIIKYPIEPREAGTNWLISL